MNVSIHQPHYLPWLPYLLKIEESDLFIFLDTVDFQKNGLQNRNRVKTAQGGQWLTVPVSQRLGQRIHEVRIDNTTDWRRKHWQTIQQSYRKAPAFGDFAKELEAMYVQEWTGLSDLSIDFTLRMLRWMNIKTPTVRSSQMCATGVASDLVLNLCREAGATRYLSGTGAKAYLVEDDFKEAGIEVVYRQAALPSAYPQQFPQAGFLNDLSALDLLLNCGEGWRRYLAEAVPAE